MEFKELVTQKPVWLTTSCFCSRENWSIILKAIRKIIENLKCDLLTFHIQINNCYGDNITIFFLTIEDKVDVVGQKIRLNLDPLFSSFPEEKFKLPINSIRLPFPINTFEFGLHLINFHEKLLSTYKIKEELSESIIDGLKDEEIANDTLITFCFYLQVSLIKACSKFLSNRDEWLSLFFIQDDLKSIAKIQAALNENQDLVLEITSEIMENEKFELEWVGRWYNACYTMIEEEILTMKVKENTENERIIENFYLKLTSLIHYHLGLSEIERKFTNNLLNYSLKVNIGK